VRTRAVRATGAVVAALIGIVIPPLLTASAPAQSAPLPGSSGAPILDPATRDYARIRATLTANSGWAVATFAGLEVIDHVLVSGPNVNVKPTTISWIMGTGVSQPVVLDLLISSPIGAAVSVTTTKGAAGSFTIDADAIATDGTATSVIDHVNSQLGVAGNNALTTTIPREALLAGRVDVGPMDDERLVMAMVHPWWYGDEWGAIGPDQPFGPWESDDPWQVDAAIDQMAFAGIDVALYSYGWPSYDTDPRIDNLIAAANNDGRLRLAPVIEMKAARDWSGGVDILDYLDGVIDSAMADVAANPDRYLRRDGRPVVFFYADWIFDTGRWNELLARAETRGNPLFAISFVEDPARRSDGYWAYTGPPGMGESQYTAHARGRTMRGRIQSILRPERQPRLVVGSVWPGYDDSSQDRADHRYEPRNNGEFYNSRWRAALEGLPDWVVVTSWNEWWEQTHVAPSTQNMTLALWQTLGWSREFDRR
jgi:hypothetical protein